MDCNDYKSLITDYLENRCTPDQCTHMELHFSECEKCRAMSEQEKSVMAQLSELPIEPCPDEIVDHVMKSISGRSMQLKERILSWFKPGCPMRHGAASLAGVLIIVLLVLSLHIPGQRRQAMESMKYSSEEIQRATIEARLAFAYFAVYSRRTETALKKIDLVEPVIRPIEEELKKALGIIPCI